MKLPTSVSQKKIKAIEQTVTDYNLDPHPMPTPEICQLFNELRYLSLIQLLLSHTGRNCSAFFVRSDAVLLHDLKMAHMNSEVELQALRYRWDAVAPGKIQPYADSEVLFCLTTVLPPQRVYILLLPCS